MSRNPAFEEECVTISAITPMWVQRVIKSYTSDTLISKIMTAKAIDKDVYADFTITDKILRYKSKVVVGSDSELRANILCEIHNSAYGGHSKVLGTYMRLKGSFNWTKIKAADTQLLRECDICQRNKHGTRSGLMEPLLVPYNKDTHLHGLH